MTVGGGSAPGGRRPTDAQRPTGVAYEQALAARASERGQAAPYDPLKLCVYATVALLAWLFGAWAVLGFAALGFAGYWRARRAGLTRSKCYLRDTRLVLAYLGLIGLAAAAALVLPYVSH